MNKIGPEPIEELVEGYKNEGKLPLLVVVPITEHILAQAANEDGVARALRSEVKQLLIESATKALDKELDKRRAQVPVAEE